MAQKKYNFHIQRDVLLDWINYYCQEHSIEISEWKISPRSDSIERLQFISSGKTIMIDIYFRKDGTIS